MSRHRLADPEYSAAIKAEIEAARTPADMLTLMRRYLSEFDRIGARFPELDCDRSRRMRAELVAEIQRLEKINTN